MPEIPTKELVDLGTALREKANQNKGVLHYAEAKEIVGRTNLEFIAAGRECVVVGVDKETVVALDYADMPPAERERQYWQQRLMEALFPHNFPHFKAVYGKTEKGVPLAYRQRIVDQEELGTIGVRLRPPARELIKYPFSRVLEVVKELALAVSFDRAAVNYAAGADGGEYYLDRMGHEEGDWDERKIDEVDKYMEKNGYSRVARETVKVSISRLRAIEQKEREKSGS